MSLGALLWTGAATVSLRRAVELAYATGATEDEILVLLASRRRLVTRG